jgi:hypothetical protein
VVASALALAAVERGAAADRDEDVLQRGAAGVVRVDVAGRDRTDVQRFREVSQGGVPPRVAALVRALELDEEVVAAEGSRAVPRLCLAGRSAAAAPAPPSDG